MDQGAAGASYHTSDSAGLPAVGDEAKKCELAPRAAPELWGAPHQQGEMSPALLRGCTVWVCFIYKKRKTYMT